MALADQTPEDRAELQKVFNFRKEAHQRLTKAVVEDAEILRS